MPHLFDPLSIRDITLPNRIAVSPMCQYSSQNGLANDWHLVHLGSRAVGGAGLVLTEATSVLPEGRISPQDLGVWGDDHVEPLARIARFIADQGSVAGIQLAHAGRKASTYRPWERRGHIPEAEGGWRPVGPSPVVFGQGYAQPEPLDKEGIRAVVKAFAQAARRATEAGFTVIEVHAAHGYLLHQFLSPLSNQRTDEYGGSFENRGRLLREVVEAVRGCWPERYPLLVRISATDWKEGGWDLDQSTELVGQLAPLGVDLVDCSSGGIVPNVEIDARAGYLVPFARQIRLETGVRTGAVGLITTASEVDRIIREEHADLVLMAREFLREPYWPLRVARELGFPVAWPVQYLRAAPYGSPARVPVDLEVLERCYADHHAIAVGPK